jgi:hypothetical protein
MAIRPREMANAKGNKRSTAIRNGLTRDSGEGGIKYFDGEGAAVRRSSSFRKWTKEARQQLDLMRGLGHCREPLPPGRTSARRDEKRKLFMSRHSQSARTF